MATTTLTPHISFAEMTYSQTASRLGINNIPTNQTIIDNMTTTAKLLEEVRTLLGNRPLVITSGYRCIALNTAIGSLPTSAHVQGQAADFICPSYGTPIDICNVIAASNIQYDQLIHEFNSWVHIAWSATPRRQNLTIDSNGTRYGF